MKKVMEIFWRDAATLTRGVTGWAPPALLIAGSLLPQVVQAACGPDVDLCMADSTLKCNFDE